MYTTRTAKLRQGWLRHTGQQRLLAQPLLSCMTVGPGSSSVKFWLVAWQVETDKAVR